MTMRSDRRGFTLIELLLVVFILALLAASTSSIVDDAHDQARYDETRNRLDQIRTAIVGPDDLTAPVAGYVADMGAPPTSLRDLLLNPNAPGGLYVVDPNTGVGAGWRGPYLRAAPRSADGALEYPDGFGNPDQVVNDANFGWRLDRSGDDLHPTRTLGALDVSVTSRGADGVLDYVADAPTSLLVEQADHHVDIAQWMFVVPVRLAPANEAVAEDFLLSARLVVPNGAGGLMETIATSSVTVRFDPAGTPEEQNTDRDVTFQFGPAATFAPATSVIPHGVRGVEVLRDGAVLTPRRVAPVDLRARAARPIRLHTRLQVGP